MLRFRVGLFIGGLIVTLAAGCAAPRRTVEAVPQADRTARYEQGQPVLESTIVNDVSVTVLHADDHAILFTFTIRNNTRESFDVSPAGWTFQQFDKAAGTTAQGKVYTFEEMANSGDNALAWDSASIVTGAAVPAAIGGIAGTIANGFLHLGMRAARQQDQTDNQTDNRPAAVSYLRRHTLQPADAYTAVVKVGIPTPPDSDDTLTLMLVTPADKHRFDYTLGT